jgi:hypothetical protein
MTFLMCWSFMILKVRIRRSWFRTQGFGCGLDQTVLGHIPFWRILERDSATRWIFFWRSKHFNLYFLCMRWWFSRSFKSFSLYNKIIKFFSCFVWNCLLILKMLTETLFKTPFSVIGRCSLVPTSHWLRGKCAKINLSQAASGLILQHHRRLPVSIFRDKIAALGSLKRVTRRIFKIRK